MKRIGVWFIVVLLVSIAPISATQYNLIYDGNGNLVTGDGKYREYNNFNQLLRIRNGSDSSGQVLEEYIYHPTEDRILVKYVYNNTNNVRQSFLYVNDNFVRSYEMRGIREVNDSYYLKDDYGIAIEKRYNGTTLSDDFSEGITLYYHNDHLGSTTVITNSSGNEVEETFYSPYGEVLEGGIESRYQYEGKELSPNTGEYDFKFRTYNPELGLFTQPDAVLSNIYDPQSLNRYRFERNNPYKYVDENGKAINDPGSINRIKFQVKNDPTFFPDLIQDFKNTWHNSEELKIQRFLYYASPASDSVSILYAISLNTQYNLYKNDPQLGLYLQSSEYQSKLSEANRAVLWSIPGLILDATPSRFVPVQLKGVGYASSGYSGITGGRNLFQDIFYKGRSIVSSSVNKIKSAIGYETSGTSQSHSYSHNYIKENKKSSGGIFGGVKRFFGGIF